MNGTAATTIGSETSRLVIIRGNSGSGKSSLAKAVRAARPRGVAIIGHDVLRREILHSEIYGAMLARLRSDHRGVTRSCCYELELDETLRRHRTKSLADEVTEETVASWYRSADCVPELDEAVLDAGVSAGDALERVLADVGWTPPDTDLDA